MSTEPQSMFDRLRATLEGGLKTVETFFKPVERAAEDVVEREVPAVEHEIVVWGQQHVNTFAPAAVAALVAAEPALAPFQAKLNGFAVSLGTGFLADLATEFPPLPPAPPAPPPGA